MRIRRSVPSTGWYAVAALALVAALGAATVVGAGLSLWRGTAAQRAIGIPTAPLLRPGSGVVTVPAHPARPTARAPQPASPQVAPPTRRVLAVGHHRPAAPVVALPRAPSVPRTPSVPRVHPPAQAKPKTRPASVPRLHVTPLPLGAIGSGGWRTLAHLLALANRVHPSIGTNGTLPAGFAVPVLVSTQEDLDDPDQPDQPAHPSHPDHDKAEHDKPEHDAYQCAGDDHGDDD